MKKKKKSVSFDSSVKIHHMYVWTFAYREARKIDWINAYEAEISKFRFALRQQEMEEILSEIGFFSRQNKK